MKTIDFSYFIERYNAGEMDDAEKQWFRKELKENEKLRKEVELRNKTDNILKNQDLLNLRKKLNSIEKQRKEQMPVLKPRPSVNIKYAAAVTVFIIIGSIAVFTKRELNIDDIMNLYYKPYEITASSRSVEYVKNPDYTLAMEYYNIHDYRNATIYFHKVLENEPGNMHSELLNGISNFEIQNYPEAKGSFIRVIADDNNYFIDHANWYLALCYIKTEEKQKAIDQLSKIMNSGTIYTKDAKRILKTLK